MRVVHPTACLLVLLPSLACSGPKESTPPRALTDPASIESLTALETEPVPVEALHSLRTVSGPTWSPDGQEIAFTTDFTGRHNLWKVAAVGGWPTQLAASNDVQLEGAWSPDEKWIAYQSDRGGDEMWDILLVPATGGSPVNLTNTIDISESDARWSPDGTSLLISYKPRGASVSDIAVIDMRTRKTRVIWHEPTKDHRWVPVAWSPDGRSIYANRINAAFTAAETYAIDVANGTRRGLGPANPDIFTLATAASPDGQALLVTSNARRGIRNVGLLDVINGKLTWVTDTQWEATAGDFSPNGKSFTYVINTDGRSEAYLADRDTLRARKLSLPPGTATPVGQPGAFSPDSKRLLISFQSSQHPADLWLYDLGRDEARQLTYSAPASLGPERIPEARLVHYRSFDGTVISAYLWVPFNLRRDGTHPAILLPHGGPTGQTKDFFNGLAAALASRGYLCLAPNFRGSTGYGIGFEKANERDFGGGDLQDVVYGAHFLAATGYVDKRKIGITGGSYGGFMTLMAIGRTPEIWAAAVSQYGIIDWRTMLEHSDPQLREYEISKLGDPVKELKTYIDSSPVTYIRNATAPLLVLQGNNDVRVPKEEAEQIVRVMQERQQTVSGHFYPDEGHGFVKRENRIDALERTLAWFDTYLKHPVSKP